MSIVLLGSTSGSITLQEPAVAGSNTISLPALTGTVALTSELQQIGVGQSYTNVTGSRVNGTAYTNSTGKPILVIIGGSDASGQSFNLTVVVGGVTILTQGGSPAGNTQTSTFIVPDSTNYTITWNALANFSFWVELR